MTPPVFWGLVKHGAIQPSSIFLDSSHNKDETWMFKALGDLMPPNKPFMGHDFAGDLPHVVRPVREIANQEEWNLEVQGRCFCLTKS